MSDAPIRFVADVPCSLQFFRDTFDRMNRLRRRRRVVISVVMLAALIGVGASKQGGVDAYVLGIAAVAAGAMIFIPALLAMLVASRAYRSSPFRDAVVRYAFDSAEGLSTTTQSPARTSSRPWSAVTNAVRFTDGLLIRFGPFAAAWIPDSAFPDAAAAAGATALVRAKVPRFREG